MDSVLNSNFFVSGFPFMTSLIWFTFWFAGFCHLANLKGRFMSVLCPTLLHEWEYLSITILMENLLLKTFKILWSHLFLRQNFVSIIPFSSGIEPRHLHQSGGVFLLFFFFYPVLSLLVVVLTISFKVEQFIKNGLFSLILPRS